MRNSLALIIPLSAIIVLSSCNDEKSKIQSDLASLTQELNEIKKDFTLSKNYYYHSSLNNRNPDEEGIFSYIDTSGTVIIEIHKHVILGTSYEPMRYFSYYDNGPNPKWKNVKSYLSSKRYELIGDSTYIKQEMNRPKMDNITKALLDEQNMDTSGIQINPSDIKTEQLIGIFSTTVDINRNDMDDTDLQEFIEDIGKQIEKQPNEEITITYGYMGGSGSESTYILNESDKKLLLDTYHFFQLQNRISDCNHRLSKL